MRYLKFGERLEWNAEGIPWVDTSHLERNTLLEGLPINRDGNNEP